MDLVGRYIINSRPRGERYAPGRNRRAVESSADAVDRIARIGFVFNLAAVFGEQLRLLLSRLRLKFATHKVLGAGPTDALRLFSF